MYDIIIIGAGPAGLTSAIYARRANKNILVLEANNYGGKILNANKIDNYPVEPNISGYDFATKLYNQAKDMGSIIKFEKVIDIKNNKDYKEVITKKNNYKTKTIIIATGSDNRKLGLDNEDKLIGKGVSYCATCDGAFYKNKNVAIIGGGNVALEDALYLSDIANKVYLIHRRDEFRTELSIVDKIKEKSNIDIILNSEVVSINATDKVNSINIRNNVDKKETTIDVDGLFIAVGQVPENQNFAKLINLDKFGYIIASENCHTNIEAIFVAGDTRTKNLRQLVTATSDGAIAATEAIKYINKTNLKNNANKSNQCRLLAFF